MQRKPEQDRPQYETPELEPIVQLDETARGFSEPPPPLFGKLGN